VVTGFTTSLETASPNNTVFASRLLASGSATNIDVVFQPKGSGAILGQLPDSTISGGNKRGQNAVDLGTTRINAADVASGNNSIVIGSFNRASALGAVAIGYGVYATGQTSLALGNGSIVTATNAVSLGVSNRNEGVGATTIGYFVSASNNAYYSFVGGFRAKGDIPYSRIWSGGQFTQAGDNQEYTSHFYTTTSTNTKTEVFMDGDGSPPSIQFGPFPSQSTYGFTGMVIARRTDANGESAMWRVSGLISNDSGTAYIVGSPLIESIADTSGGVWDVSIEISNFSYFGLYVTGQTGKSIRWSSTITFMKISE
jgi:hypothetical protein